MRPGVVLRLDAELDQPVPVSPALGEPAERRAARDLPLPQRPHVQMGIDVHRCDAARYRAQERRMARERAVMATSGEHDASARLQRLERRVFHLPVDLLDGR